MECSFASHSWKTLRLLLFAVCGHATNQEVNDFTYKKALFWGAAHPDHSGCWERDRTFERCCVKWDSGTSVGQQCWPNETGKEYQSCCVAKADQPPRSFFSCVGKGLFWERLRQTLSLFQSFQALAKTPLEEADPKECLLGGVLASLLALVHITRVNRTLEQKHQDYDRAEYMLKVLFSSPITLEEILVSGWPLFLTLDFFRFDVGFQQLAERRLPGIMAGDQTLRFCNTLSSSIQGESVQRIQGDLVGKLVMSVARSREQVLWQLMPVFMALVNYHNLRKIDLPLAGAAEVPVLGQEAKNLILFADARLKYWISLFSHPFSLLIKVEVPLVNLLQALSWPGVVLTNPGSYLFDTVHFPGSRLPQHKPSHLPLLEQHIHPGFDAASNMVRTTNQPMCYAPGFLFVVLGMANLSGPLRVWDIGASYGDCLLWSASFLTGRPLELRGFEALPAAAAAFRRSAESLQARASPDLTVLVEEMAMRDTRGSIQISFPSHSMALATFHRCHERYGEASNHLFHCIQRSTISETLDAYLQRVPGAGPVDFLKVHVQGDELAVLRGAKVSLATGQVCVLHMNLETLSLRSSDPKAMELFADEVLDILEGFRGMLVSLWDQRPATRQAVKDAIVSGLNPDLVAWRPPDPNRPPKATELRHELVAWTELGRCLRSSAVRAVRDLWGSMAVAWKRFDARGQARTARRAPCCVSPRSRGSFWSHSD